MNVEIPIKCPKCGHTIKKTLTQLSHKQDITCPCGTVFAVDPAGFKSAGKAISDFEKSISKFGK